MLRYECGYFLEGEQSIVCVCVCVYCQLTESQLSLPI